MPGRVIITDVYDNISSDERLSNEPWGFAAVVDSDAGRTLLDTGADGDVLLGNMNILGIDPSSVDRLVLSHVHQDHIGGASRFLAESGPIDVFMPDSFPESIEEDIRSAGGRPQRVKDVMEIAPGLCSTGEVTGVVSEQSLVVETPQGAALLTGCAHPGLMKIVEAAGRCAGGPVKVVAGGFHLRDLDAEEVTAICRELHDRGVERASASHCTGEAQTQIIAEFFGEGWTPLGAGASVVIE